MSIKYKRKVISLNAKCIDTFYPYYLSYKDKKSIKDFALFYLVFKDKITGEYSAGTFKLDIKNKSERECRDSFAIELYKFINNPDLFIKAMDKITEEPKIVALMVSYLAYRDLSKPVAEQLVRFGKPSSSAKECIFLEGYVNDDGFEDFLFAFFKINQGKVMKEKCPFITNTCFGECNNFAQSIMNRIGVS